MGFTLTSPSAQSVRRTRQCLLVGTDPKDYVCYLGLTPKHATRAFIG